LVIKVLGSVFESRAFVGDRSSARVCWVSVSRKSGIIAVFSVKSECEKENGLVGGGAFEVGFDFVFEAGV